MRLRNFFAQLAAALSISLVLAGCGSSSSSSSVPEPTPPAVSQLEVLHAVADAPAVNVFAGGEALLTDVPFKAGSGFVEVEEGDLEVRVEAIVPGGNLDVIGPVDLSLPGNERITVIAIGEAGGGTIEPLVLLAPLADLDADEARLRVVHAAPNAPMVDIYATAPEDDLSGATPLGSASFGEDLGPLTVAEGTYRIRVTAASDASAVVFDSGPVDVPGGADLVITAVENTGAGDAPISLVVLDGTGAFEILDQNTGAAARVIHASPDAFNVDVLVEGVTPPAVADLAFPEFTGYLPLPAETINVQVVETGTTEPAAIDADLDLVAGFEYSVFAVGLAADIAPLVLVDDNRRIATEARVRIVHGAPSAPEVDLYVVPAAADFTDFDPAFTAVPFTADTGYVSLAPGDYDVVVTVADTVDVAIGPVPVTVEAGGIYTAVARDEVGGGGPFGLILLDDLAP